jgi:hypothetical protein
MPLIKKSNEPNGSSDDIKIAKIKATIARAAAMGNKSAIRMTMPNPPSLIFKDEEGFMSEGTHYMASMGNYAVPFIQQGKDGKLFYNKNASPNDAEAIQFDNEEDARYFAENYKKIAPMMRSSKFLKKSQ